MSHYLNPPYTEWECRPPSPNHREELRSEAREQLLAVARDWTRELLCEARGRAATAQLPSWVEVIDQSLQQIRCLPDSDNRLILTGHQPVVFHAGLEFKYRMTDRAARDHDATAVSVVIDTDRGDPLSYSIPVTGDVSSGGIVGEDRFPVVQTGSVTLSDPASVQGSSELPNAEELAARISKLRACSDAVPSERLEAFNNELSLIRAFVGGSAMKASVVLRRLRSPSSSMLDVPLSTVAGLPAVQRWYAELLQDPWKLHQRYNQLLRDYRRDHQIKDQINPFPDLGGESESYELPFWLFDAASGERRPLWATADGRIAESNLPLQSLFSGVSTGNGLTAKASGDQEAETRGLGSTDLDWPPPQDLILIPRHALITGTFRSLLADLFIHGRGGEHYEPFTTLLGESLWDQTLCPYAVASASAWLFPDAKQRLEQLSTVQNQLREITFHPERFFDEGLFSADSVARLQQLGNQKRQAVEALKSARSDGRSAAEIHREIKQISTEIRKVAEQEFSDSLRALEDLSAETRSTLLSRTFPVALTGVPSTDTATRNDPQ